MSRPWDEYLCSNHITKLSKVTSIIKLSCVCLFVCLRVTKVTLFSCIHSTSKWSPNFTKPSAYVKFGLQSCFKLFGSVHVPACTHSAWNRARYFCLLFCQFFDILKPFLTENEKTETTLQIGIDEAHLFDFIHFFPFHSGRPSKWPKCVKNVKKSTFLAKIWDLGIKVIK